MATRAFSDVRQVVAISAVGTPFDAALAMPGVARLKQNRPVARSFRLVVHAGIWPPGVTPNCDFIVRLLGSQAGGIAYDRTPNAAAMVRREAALINSCE